MGNCDAGRPTVTECDGQSLGCCLASRVGRSGVRRGVDGLRDSDVARQWTAFRIRARSFWMSGNARMFWRCWVLGSRRLTSRRRIAAGVLRVGRVVGMIRSFRVLRRLWVWVGRRDSVAVAAARARSDSCGTRGKCSDRLRAAGDSYWTGGDGGVDRCPLGRRDSAVVMRRSGRIPSWQPRCVVARFCGVGWSRRVPSGRAGSVAISSCGMGWVARHACGQRQA